MHVNTPGAANVLPLDPPKQEPIHGPAGADWREPTPQKQGHAKPGDTMPLASDPGVLTEAHNQVQE